MLRKLWHKLQKITEKSSREWNIIMLKLLMNLELSNWPAFKFLDFLTYNIKLRRMKAIIAAVLLAVASALRVEQSHEYFWESCWNDSQCPAGKACTGPGSATMGFGGPTQHCQSKWWSINIKSIYLTNHECLAIIIFSKSLLLVVFWTRSLH